jgi:hypothetical protein
MKYQNETKECKNEPSVAELAFDSHVPERDCGKALLKNERFISSSNNPFKIFSVHFAIFLLL